MAHVKTISSIIGKLLLVVVIAFVVTIILMIPVMLVLMLSGFSLDDMLGPGMNNLKNPFALASGIAQAIGFVIGVWLVYVWFERHKGWMLGMRTPQRWLPLLQGSLLGIGLISLIFLVLWSMGIASVVRINVTADSWRSMGLSFLLFMFVSWNEEVFSRGYVQGLVKHHYGKITAVICSTVVFTVLHTMNPGALEHPLPLLNIMLAGLLLGVSRERSGSLWQPIGIHLTWNFFQGSVYGFAVSGNALTSMIELDLHGSPVVSGGSFGAEGSIVTSIVLLGAIWFMLIQRQGVTRNSSG